MKIPGSGSGSIDQMHGSADSDPDPLQNVMDPQHWLVRYKKVVSGLVKEKDAQRTSSEHGLLHLHLLTTIQRFFLLQINCTVFFT
jgi:hypothetical protein